MSSDLMRIAELEMAQEVKLQESICKISTHSQQIKNMELELEHGRGEIKSLMNIISSHQIQSQNEVSLSPPSLFDSAHIRLIYVDSSRQEPSYDHQRAR